MAWGAKEGDKGLSRESTLSFGVRPSCLGGWRWWAGPVEGRYRPQGMGVSKPVRASADGHGRLFSSCWCVSCPWWSVLCANTTWPRYGTLTRFLLRACNDLQAACGNRCKCRWTKTKAPFTGVNGALLTSILGSGHAALWRRGRDSNPRRELPLTRFPGVRLKPLIHLSEAHDCISGKGCFEARHAVSVRRWTRLPVPAGGWIPAPPAAPRRRPGLLSSG